MTHAYKTKEAAAKRYALARGHRGAQGGWIYDAAGEAICQGWMLYAFRLMDRGLIVGDWKSGYTLKEVV
jgi:hypothetical protein